MFYYGCRSPRSVMIDPPLVGFSGSPMRVCCVRKSLAKVSLYILAVCMVGAVDVSASYAQAPLAEARTEAKTKLPEFEIAWIKPTPPDDRVINALLTYPGGRVLCRGCDIQYLVMEAFHLQRFQVSGDWKPLGEKRFNFEAKPPLTSPSTKSNPSTPKADPSEEQRQMLESLLIDRFHLRFHWEASEGRVYFLTLDPKKSKLQPPQSTQAYSWAGGIGGGLPDGDGLRGINITMRQLSERVGSWLHTPVEDQTGVSGAYDFQARVGESDSDSSIDIASSVFTALKDLGFSLKPGRGQVKTLVVDHVDPPSAN